MRKHLSLLSCMLALAGTGLTASVHAQQGKIEKDPTRWTAEDTTSKARYQTLKKEADAGLRENMKQCKSLPAAERSACTKEAKSNHQQDLKRAKEEMNNKG
jgi:hypothetical protein